MHRFFIPPESLTGEIVEFPAQTARQMAQVLRLRRGDQVIVLNNDGSEYTVTLTRVDPHQVTGHSAARRDAAGEPSVYMSLYIALTQREKFEWILQKCTEIGVSAFLPVITSRSLVQDPAEAVRKLPRWQSILREAAEQSGRGRIPTLMDPLRFDRAIQQSTGLFDQAFIPWEQETTLTLRHALARHPLPQPVRLAVFIGPEGGFTAEEISLSSQHGWLPVSLGPRILRMETAAMVSATLVLTP